MLHATIATLLHQPTDHEERSHNQPCKHSCLSPPPPSHPRLHPHHPILHQGSPCQSFFSDHSGDFFCPVFWLLTRSFFLLFPSLLSLPPALSFCDLAPLGCGGLLGALAAQRLGTANNTQRKCIGTRKPTRNPVTGAMGPSCHVNNRRCLCERERERGMEREGGGRPPRESGR